MDPALAQDTTRQPTQRIDIEIGAVLSRFDLGHGEGSPKRPPQRFHVFREHGVASTTLRAVPYEYEVALTDYGTCSELHEPLARFVAWGGARRTTW